MHISLAFGEIWQLHMCVNDKIQSVSATPQGVPSCPLPVRICHWGFFPPTGFASLFLVTESFWLTVVFVRSLYVVCVWVFPLLFWLSSMLLCIHTTCFSIPLWWVLGLFLVWDCFEYGCREHLCTSLPECGIDSEMGPSDPCLLCQPVTLELAGLWLPVKSAEHDKGGRCSVTPVCWSVISCLGSGIYWLFHWLWWRELPYRGDRVAGNQR